MRMRMNRKTNKQMQPVSNKKGGDKTPSAVFLPASF